MTHKHEDLKLTAVRYYLDHILKKNKKYYYPYHYNDNYILNFKTFL